MASDGNEDDFFASLGGSLMKDLLADLQVDDGDTGAGWLSLEQLEQELAHLDSGPGGNDDMDDAGANAGVPASTAGGFPFVGQQQGGGGRGGSLLSTTFEQPPTTAASMVVSRQAGQFQQQQQQQGMMSNNNNNNNNSTTPNTPTATQDAWSVSLERFTAASSSLGQDFLQADSARKQQHQTTSVQVTTTATSSSNRAPPGLDFSGAEDYDVSEPPVSAKPPPGIRNEDADQQASASANANASDNVLAEAANKLAQQMQSQMRFADVPQPSQQVQKELPPFPSGGIPKPTPMTPQNSMSVGPDGRVIPPTPPPSMQSTPSVARHVATTDRTGGPAVPSFDAVSEQQQPPQQQQQPNMPPQQQQQQQPPAAVPVAVPVPTPTRTNAWQSPARAPAPPDQQQAQQQQQQQVQQQYPQQQQVQQQQVQHQQQYRRPVYCNPHPRAPPIPAQQLQGKYMKSRDISYVVHAILRPILAAAAADSSGGADDYDVQYMLRRNGGGNGQGQGGPPPPTAPRAAPAVRVAQRPSENKDDDTTSADGAELDATSAEIASRSKKAKEWSNQHAVLGYVAKTNVTRPRALLAETVAVPTPDDDLDGGAGQDDPALASTYNKQRASLWKARIYCDQAYQAYANVIESWRAAKQQGLQPSSAVQLHLVKLSKCLGLTRRVEANANTEGNTAAAASTMYVQDSEPLQLLLKLHKGKVLVARVLEQALLPPNAVQALLPAILQVLYTTSSINKEGDNGNNNVTDDRLFLAIARIVQTLPHLTGPTIVQCVQTVGANSGTSLHTTNRMNAVHALLQRGNSVAHARDGGGGDPAFQAQWTETEAEFVKVLTGM